MGGVAGFPDGAWDAIRFGLFEAARDRAGRAWERDVLGPWAAANRATLAAIRRVGRPEFASVPLDSEDLWTLYALSRLTELLIEPAQPAPAGAAPGDTAGDTAGAAPGDTAGDTAGDDAGALPPGAYQRFIATLGGIAVRDDRFHPFLHEIVAVEPADDPDEPPSVVAHWWPGCLLGALSLVRAGVTVRAGAHHLDPAVAAGSTLYWAWRRRYRPAADLSHGWGHNSQWRTEFRRDYLLPDRLAYNVDAALRPRRGRSGSELPPDEAVELVRYRCGTRVDPGPDEWIWDSHHTEPSGEVRGVGSGTARGCS